MTRAMREHGVVVQPAGCPDQTVIVCRTLADQLLAKGGLFIAFTREGLQRVHTL